MRRGPFVVVAAALVAAAGCKERAAPPRPDGAVSEAGVPAPGIPAGTADAAAGRERADAAEPGEAVEAEAPLEPLPDVIPLPCAGRVPLAAPDLGPATAGQMVAIPAATFLRGSLPGSRGRDPAREVDLVPASVAAFEIDRLPFPDDPARPFAGNLTLREAGSRCGAAGKRLCTEVEWEVACKGPRSQDYPYGDDYRPDGYASLEGVSSSFGVLGMTTLYEWTAGDWLDGAGRKFDRIAPLRGAHPSEGDAVARRCAARTGLDPERGSPRTGFRCCRGEGFPGAYGVEPTRRAFRPGPMMTDPMFARLVRSIPELARVHSDPRIQSEEQLRKALIRSRRNEAVGPGWVYSVQPVLWIPGEGDELLAVVGRCGKELFTAALYTTGQPGVYVHAASLVLLDVAEDDGIILFGGTRDRKLLGWGECDDCTQAGSYQYQDDRSVTIGHRW